MVCSPLELQNHTSNLLSGSGIFVRTEHLPAVLDTPDFSLKAIYSRSLTSAQKLEGVPTGVDLYSGDSSATLDDLLARSDIQAVIIA